MEKDRSRGLKHIKDKTKYKGNTTKNPKHVPPKQLPKLESNWDRYKEVTYEETPAGDFSILSSGPIVQGHHYQSKQDKLLVQTIDQNDTLNDLLCLDLEKLTESILTIPFYKRIQADESYFSEAQLKIMKATADENREKYLKNNVKNVRDVRRSDGDSKTFLNHEQAADIKEIPKLIEKQLNLKETALKKDEVIEVEKNFQSNKEHDDEGVEDLEKWLDDFLDD